MCTNIGNGMHERKKNVPFVSFFALSLSPSPGLGAFTCSLACTFISLGPTVSRERTHAHAKESTKQTKQNEPNRKKKKKKKKHIHYANRENNACDHITK